MVVRGMNKVVIRGKEHTFVSPSMSQSFASILAVSEDSGGQDASRLDKPRRGGGSRVS